MARNIFRRKTPVEVGPQTMRVRVVAICVALAFAAILARAWYVQVESNELYMAKSKNQHESTLTVNARRGNLYDANGRELAITAMVPSVFAIPKAIDNPRIIAPKLAQILNMDEAFLVERLERDKHFIWLKRHLKSTEAEAIKALEHEGIQLRDEPRRFYPNKGLAGALIGFSGIDGRGLEGLEKAYDRYLRGRSYEVSAVTDAKGRQSMTSGTVPIDRLSGQSLVLTIDARIQEVAERILAKQVEEMGAKGAVVVVMDPRTGDIVAWAQSPHFDPNQFERFPSDAWRNRLITDVTEPGSTIKTLLVAAALDAGKTTADAIWPGHYGKIRVGNSTISDVHGVKNLTTLEIIQRSSNVGAVQVAQRMGKELWHQYLGTFGLGKPTDLGLPGEQKGVLRPHAQWRKIDTATSAYGYGLSVTPLQMVRAISSIANGGHLMKPRLVKAVVDPNGDTVKEFEPRIVRRVLSEHATHWTTKGMIMATQKGGTARRARVAGYTVAGKTGTAHKFEKALRGYNKEKVVSSFAGFAPAENPRLAVYVAVDEPEAAEYGGIVAAPIFAEIIKHGLPYLGVKATAATSVSDSAYAEAIDDEESAEGLDPQARPWWLEQAIVTGAKDYLIVPSFKGLPLDQVIGEAESLSIKLQIKGAGVVLRQEPQAGAFVASDTVVTVAMGLPGDRRQTWTQ